eukprot:4053279-Amphidinium_carterae.1
MVRHLPRTQRRTRKRLSFELWLISVQPAGPSSALPLEEEEAKAAVSQPQKPPASFLKKMAEALG